MDVREDVDSIRLYIDSERFVLSHMRFQMAKALLIGLEEAWSPLVEIQHCRRPVERGAASTSRLES